MRNNEDRETVENFRADLIALAAMLGPGDITQCGLSGGSIRLGTKLVEGICPAPSKIDARRRWTEKLE
jgi:hypothetical protein